MKSNTRNKNGVKDSIDCYLTLSGLHFNQMTDFRLNRETNEMSDLSKDNIELEMSDLSKEFPTMVFKARKVSGLYRIYGAEK
jgi:hypothetical protein